MKLSKYHTERLSAYSLLAGACIFSVQKSNGQVIYTDVVPDDTLFTEGPSGFFDLNNDGEDEFEMSINKYGASGDLIRGVIQGACGYCPNSILAASLLSEPYTTGYADRLNENDVICDKAGYWIFGGKYSAFLFEIDEGNFSGSWEAGTTDKYLGLRFRIIETSSDFHDHYAWLRLDVAADTSFVVVKDYAYEAIAYECIGAGAGMPSGGCSDSYEPNDGSAVASIIPVNQKIEGLISTSGEKDWFKFEVPPVKNNIRIVLKSLPANYNLKLLDENLQVLGTSKHPGIINDTVIYNNAVPSQQFYVVVKGQNVNAFNAGDCYALRIQASIDPYKLPESSVDTDESDLFDLSPNPASERIIITGDFSEESKISIYDLSGRRILMQQASGEETTISVNNLPEGFYILEIKSVSRLFVEKFQVGR